MTIHWVGTGLSAVPGLRKLITDGHEVRVWNRTLEKAVEAVGDLTRRIHEFSLDALSAEVAQGDVIVSMLPGDWHVPLAEIALEKSAHFVSSSYISPEMRRLHARAQLAGLSFVNEVGLDPGIDHLMAHYLVADYRGSDACAPGNEISFISYCGGIPKVPNPFNYKFSWSPLGVLKALRSPSRSIRDFEVLEVSRPWEALGSYTAPLPTPETFEVYPNRDSLPFIEEYNFDPTWKIRDFVRGTLRLNGWAGAWAEVFQHVEELDDDGLRKLSDRLWRDNAYADKDDPDRVVLCVSLKAARDGQTVWHKSFLLDAWGDETSTAMARLVSIPVSLAVEAALAGKLPAGVQAAPSHPTLLRQWLNHVGELAQHLDTVHHV